MFPYFNQQDVRLLARGILCWMILAIGLQSGQRAMGQSSVEASDKMQAINPRVAAPFEIDPDRVAAHGIRILESQHLIMYTDSQQRADIEQLPAAFDLAVQQWCRYFQVDVDRVRHWKMRAFVIDNRKRFEQAGLMPSVLPPFPAGFQYGRDMWVYLQPGDYYTRHLLLHEGTHAFMEWFLGGWGSPWYSEGMAEKLGLHQWSESSAVSESKPDSEPLLLLNFEVTDKLQVPHWGRINLIKKDLAQDQLLSLNQSVTLPATAFREVKHYGWAWAACQFLSQHALTRESFAQLKRHVSEGSAKFDARVAKMLQPHLSTLEQDWVLFLHELDYGLKLSRVALKSAEPLQSSATDPIFQVDSAHGWQLTHLKVKAGDRFQIRCPGKFQVGITKQSKTDRPWISTADGITLEYYQAKPLGVLLAGILSEQGTAAEQVSGLLNPTTIGSHGWIEATSAGRLCLRINDSPAKMGDNQGVLEVVVEKVK